MNSNVRSSASRTRIRIKNVAKKSETIDEEGEKGSDGKKKMRPKRKKLKGQNVEKALTSRNQEDVCGCSRTEKNANEVTRRDKEEGTTRSDLRAENSEQSDWLILNESQTDLTSLEKVLETTATCHIHEETKDMTTTWDDHSKKSVPLELGMLFIDEISVTTASTTSTISAPIPGSLSGLDRIHASVASLLTGQSKISGLRISLADLVAIATKSADEEPVVANAALYTNPSQHTLSPIHGTTVTTPTLSLGEKVKKQKTVGISSSTVQHTPTEPSQQNPQTYASEQPMDVEPGNNQLDMDLEPGNMHELRRSLYMYNKHFPSTKEVYFELKIKEVLEVMKHHHAWYNIIDKIMVIREDDSKTTQAPQSKHHGFVVDLHKECSTLQKVKEVGKLSEKVKHQKTKANLPRN
ncbi:hypothetical protein Tco_0456689 [Tanacetum coccineum]